MIPKDLLPYFWDIDIHGFNPSAYPEYTIGRILELGNPETVSWMKATFSEEQIKTVIRTERRLSPKSATFWTLVYRIPFQAVTAIELFSPWPIPILGTNTMEPIGKVWHTEVIAPAHPGHQGQLSRLCLPRAFSVRVL